MQNPDSIYHFYRHLIELRQNSKFKECLIYGDIMPLETQCQDMIAYMRKTEKETICCYFSFSAEVQNEFLPAEISEIVLSTKTAVYEGKEISLAPFQTFMAVIK